MPHLLKVGILTPEVRITRPSALGMWDPICGPLIHNFVDERLHQVNYENSVYFKDFKKKGERKGGKYLEKGNMFV